MKRIRIKVTQGDIDNGMPHVPSSCPIALALNRTVLCRRSHVFNREGLITWGADRMSFEFPLPRSARKFIRDFDAELPVRPFWFYLVPPDGVDDIELRRGDDGDV